MPPGGAALMQRLTAAYGDMGEAPGFFASHLSVREYDPTEALRIGGLTLTFAPGVHYIPSWAMRIRPHDGSGDIGYTGDTGPAARLDTFFHGAHTLLAEATLLDAPPGSAATRGSLTAREAGELAARAEVNTLVLTHLWEERGFDRALADARAVFSGPVLLARPGLRVTSDQ
jgi:ribonuclease BN (tRNA processing enzyme)